MTVDDTLDGMARKYGSDKCSYGHNYTPIYAQLFEPLRHRPIALLELGVCEGYSLRTWAEYFTHSDTLIVGIDNGPGGLNLPTRVVKYLADQTEIPPELLDWRPDIVIDDASHISSKTIGSFKTWFPVLKPGGLYVVEDVHTSYNASFAGRSDGNSATPQGAAAHEVSDDPDRPPPANPHGQTAMQFLRRLADEVQSFAIKPQYHLGFDVQSVCFHPDLVVVRKKTAQSTRLDRYGLRPTEHAAPTHGVDVFAYTSPAAPAAGRVWSWSRS